MPNIVEIILKAKDEASTVVSDMADKHEKAFTRMGAALLGASVAVGGASVKMGTDFDTAMRSVNTLLQLPEDQFQALKSSVLELSGELGKGPTEMAEALYQVVSSGAAEAGTELDFLRIAAEASIGGLTDVLTAVDGLSTVVNAFGLEASETRAVADIMFAAVKKGKTTFGELSASMFQAAPLAATLGVNFEDVAAATATLTKSGAPTSVALTQIRASLVALTKPSTEMSVLLESIGYQSGEAALQTLGYVGTMQALVNAVNGNNDALATAFGRVEGLNAALGVSGDKYAMALEDLNAMTSATDGLGESTLAFNEMNKSAGRQWEITTSEIKNTAIEISEGLLPVIGDLLEEVKPVIEAVGDWATEHPELTAAIIATTGALGAALLVVPKAVTTWEALKAVHLATKIETAGHTAAIIAHTVATTASTVATGFLTAATTAFGIAMNLALGPIGLVLAAIGLVAAGAYLIIDNWSAITDFFAGIFDKIVGFVTDAIDWVKEQGIKILLYLFPLTAIATLIYTYRETILEKLGEMWEAIKSFLKEWGLFVLGLIFPPALIAGIIIKWGDTIKEKLGEAWEAIKEFMKEWGLFVLGLIFPPALIAGIIIKWGDTIKEKLGEAWNIVLDFVKDWGLLLLGLIFPPALIAGTMLRWGDEVMEGLRTVIDGIKDFFVDWGTTVKDQLQGFWDEVTTFVSEWGLFLLGLIFPPALVAGIVAKYKDEILTGLSDLWVGMKDFAGELWERILSWFLPVTKVPQYVRDLKTSVIDGLLDIWSAIKDIVSEWGLFIIGAIFPPALVAGVIIKWKDELLEKLTDLKDKIIGVFTGIGEGIGDAFLSIPNTILSVFNSMIDTISGLELFSIPKKVIGGTTVFPGWTLTTPNIPNIPLIHLATGGIIRNPAIAEIAEREPEVVIPLSRMDEVIKDITVPTTNIEQTTNIQAAPLYAKLEVNFHTAAFLGNRRDAQEFARMLQEYLRREERLSTGEVRV